MKKILCTAICLLLINASFAQNAHFITSGTIEFDKTANMYAVIGKLLDAIEKMDKNALVYFQRNFDQYKKTQPQFRTLKSTLTFDGDKTLYTPTGPEPVAAGIYTPMADNTNITYNDLTTHISTSQKPLFETTFVVKDTTLKINWKITDETQVIAGYTCRRANAIVLDSVYVVAFYTDKIPVTGGPECFTGLPGMILKLALPHENIIWTAIKITDTSVPPIVAPKKGKLVDKKGLQAALAPALKNAGPYGPVFLKALAL